MGPLIIILLGSAGFALVVHLLSLGLVYPRVRGKNTLLALPDPAPRISLLRPLHGLEYRLEDTLTSGLKLDYPNAQLLFCIEDEEDPAVALVRGLMAAHPTADAQLLIGRDAVSQNPKLNNLIKGWRAADGPWVVMADSNIMLPPDYLQQLLACWTAGTGLVSSPAYGAGPANWGGALECAFLNTYEARWQLAADQVGRGYAQGKTLFWQKSFLDEAGGPEVLAQEIAEDAASTKLVRGAGLKVHLAPRPFAQPVGARRWKSVWARQVRWAIIRRMGFPALFMFEPLSSAGLPLVAFALGAYGGGLPMWMPLLFALLWYGGEWALARRAGWPASPRDIGAMLLRDAMIPAVWLAAWRKSSFEWQGAKLAAEKEEPTP